MYTFVKFDDNYSDEFDVEGFRLFKTEEEWEALLATYPDENIEWYFGTNELVEWDTKEKFTKSFHVTHINNDVAEVLIGIFGDNILQYGYGMFPYEYHS